VVAILLVQHHRGTPSALSPKDIEMNELLRLRRPATTGFSTDHTTNSVNRISQRPPLASRPETNEQRSNATAHASLPLEHLYPSLYAGHASLFQRGGNYLRAIANQTRQTASGTATRAVVHISFSATIIVSGGPKI
jgi:hypothetical protein